MIIKPAATQRVRQARIRRGYEEVTGYILPMSQARVAQMRVEDKLVQAAQARRIAEARARTDRRGLRRMWRRRVAG